MAENPNESFWPKLKALAEAGSYQEMVDEVQRLPSIKEQVALLRFTVRGLMFREWSPKTLEPILLLGDLAIQKAFQSGDIDEANIICYNMSANLAGCWNDGFQRTTLHFNKGLEYAERALEFRKQLKKGPGPFSLAYWAKGMHHFSLKQFAEAEESFQKSLQSAEEAARAEGKTTNIAKDSPFAVLIAHGYIALTQMARGQHNSEEYYQRIISAFEAMKETSADAKADAEIGISQLEYVHSSLK